jgi:hypothetical protein
MELKYHQETYRLLTEKPIDRRDGIERYYDDLIRAHVASGQDAEEVRRRFEEERRRALSWTRLDLYQRPVRFSEANIQQLDALEYKYRVKLPASVREWFRLDITPEIMSAPIPEFGYLDIHDFRPFTEMPEIYGTSENREDFWFFLHSEYIDQGGEFIAFKMNAGDDPPVYAENLDEFVELASTFSEFIYQHFWNWHSWYTFKYGFSIEFISILPSSALSPEFLIPVERLRNTFKELIGKTRWWFYDEHSRIWPYKSVSWINKEMSVDESQVAGGRFAADSLEALQSLITRIWEDYPPFLRMETRHFNEESETFINQMQRETVLRILQETNGWVTSSELAKKLGSKIGLLNTHMSNQLQFHIDAEAIESHPDNQDPPTPDNRYRAKS